MREPAGLRVLITGEGSAVSQASASLFRAHGARCSVLEDRRESGAGIHGAAVSAAEELGGLDVLVNCVGRRSHGHDRASDRRAAAIVHLASPGSAALSGAEVTVDGGLTTIG